MTGAMSPNLNSAISAAVFHYTAGYRNFIKKTGNGIYAKKVYKGIPKNCTVTVKNQKVKKAVEKTGYQGKVVEKS